MPGELDPRHVLGRARDGMRPRRRRHHVHRRQARRRRRSRRGGFRARGQGRELSGGRGEDVVRGARRPAQRRRPLRRARRRLKRQNHRHPVQLKPPRVLNERPVSR